MDKNEYREKTEQMLECIKQKNYQEAVEIAEDIEWKKVKNVALLCAASEIYEYSGNYQKSQEILMSAYERSPESRKIVYRLGALALKLDDVKEATACYEEFVEMAPKDPNQYILRYKILREQGAPLEKQIEALEEFKKTEYVEKWAFELAKLYDEAGMTAECLEECDDLILWFSEGKFVNKAMELKMQYKPLTPLQQEKYMQRLQSQTAEEPKEEAPAETVVEEPKEEAPVEIEVEEPKEEAPAETEVEEPKEEEIEIPEEHVEEQKSPTSGLSIQEILENWEEKQKENAQIIQAEQERVQKELEETKAEEAAEEVESVLPDDIRQLMEELESESEEIRAQKVAPAPKKSLTGRLPDMGTVAEAIAEVTGAVGAAVAGAAAAGSVASDVPQADMPETKKEEKGIQLGNTQDMMNVAKALMNDTVVETPEKPETEEKKTGRSKYDTGFVVQGRYDLEAQSDVGLKAGLTEEQKKLFSYFVPVHGMSEQIVEVLEQDKKCRSRYGTSRTGNVLIVGRKGSGKTVLAVNIVKAIQKNRRAKQSKLAIVKAESLNKKDVSQITDKLYGGAIVIERAARLNKRTISQLNDLMEEQTGELLVVLEDERKSLDKMLAANPRFSKKFTSRVELPVFINDELVTFGQTYAKENGYKIDEMGILALYTHIDMLQRDEEVVTVADVKELVDRAIEHSRKINVKHLAKKLLGKSKDESDRVLLTEQDFKL